MYRFTLTDAVEIVRKNLDEFGVPVEQFCAQSDDYNFEEVIVRSIPEAINHINVIAPSTLLEGVQISPVNVKVANGAMSFEIHHDICRLAAFRASDSYVTIVDVVSENSAEGRKQLNQYVRGTYDNPVLVQHQGKAEPFKFTYYTCSSNAAGIDVCEFVLNESYNPDKKEYYVATELFWPIMNYLTGMVLTIHGEQDKAQVFYNRSSFQQ